MEQVQFGSDTPFKILIVDDEDAARRLIADILESKNYLTLSAESTAQAVQVMKAERPDLVLSDIRMPGESGLKLITYAQSMYQDLPVILITGHGDKNLTIEAIRAGAFDFIEKPFEDEELFAAVQRVVEHRRLLQKLKEAQAQNIQAAKLASIGELAAGVGHEINNPLTVILGQLYRIVSFAKRNQISDEKFFKSIQIAEKAANRIAKIVKGLAAYARKDEGDFSVVDIKETIEESVELVRGIYEHDRIVIESSYDATNHQILGNRGKFQQVIINLLSNARDAIASKEHGKIVVTTANIGSFLLVKITDNGCGIGQENLHRIFDSFFTTKEVGKGTGLGLSISFRIISEIKGKIEVDSKTGEGSTFKITLPTVCQEVEKRSLSDREEFSPLEGRVLIVEDEQDVRELLREYLESFGFCVVEAENGNNAMRHIVGDEFDILVTDLKMPQMTGYELVKRVNDFKLKDLKIFVVTASLKTAWSEENQDELTNLIDGYILKPFSKKDLYDLLSKEGRTKKKIA